MTDDEPSVNIDQILSDRLARCIIQRHSYSSEFPINFNIQHPNNAIALKGSPIFPPSLLHLQTNLKQFFFLKLNLKYLQPCGSNCNVKVFLLEHVLAWVESISLLDRTGGSTNATLSLSIEAPIRRRTVAAIIVVVHAHWPTTLGLRRSIRVRYVGFVQNGNKSGGCYQRLGRVWLCANTNNYE